MTSLRSLLTILFILASTAPLAADEDSQCSHDATAEYRTCLESKNWCGFDTFVATSPRTKYLVESISETASGYNYSGYMSNGASGISGPSLSCPGTVAWSASADTGLTNWGVAVWRGSGANIFVTNLYYSGPQSVSASLSGRELPHEENLNTQPTTGEITFTPSSVGSVVLTSTNCVTNTFTSIPLALVCLSLTPSSLSPTVKVLTNCNGYSVASQTMSLSQEYTRQSVEEQIIGDLAGCPTSDFLPGAQYAYSELADPTITLQKLSYRIGFQSEADTSYLVTWDELTQYDDGSSPQRNKQSETVAGNGDRAYTQEHILLPPLNVGGHAGVDESTIKVVALNTGGGCCGGDSTPGTGDTLNGSVEAHFQLGKGLFDRAGGQLYILQEIPTAQLATPATLQFAGNTNYFDVVTSSQGIRQVKGAQSFVDVLATNAYFYSLNFYSLSNTGTKGTNGLYTFSNSPFVSWTILNPDGPASTNRLQVIENRDSKSITNEFDWFSSSNTLAVTTGNGLRTETKQVQWTNNIQTETRQVFTGTNQLVGQETKRYQKLSFGMALIEQHTGAPGQEFAITNTYYDSSTPGNSGLLNTVTRSDGSWDYYSGYDTSRRPTVKNSAGPVQQGPSNPGPRQTSFAYGITGVLDDGSNPNEPRRVDQSLFSQPIARRFLIRQRGLRIEIQDTFASGDIGYPDPRNLQTTNSYYTNGPFSGYLMSTRHPDGTVSAWLYQANATQKIVTFLTGQPGASATNVINGTQTVTVIGLAGQTLSNTVYSVPDGTILSQEVYSGFDELYRPTVVTYLDGTSTQFGYNCCGLDHFIDREGTRTDYTYDDLKRLLSDTRNGITVSYSYDGAGRRLTTTRQGTDGTSVYLDRSAFDLAGRLIGQTNALGYPTAYSETYVTNQTVKTITFPDQSTKTTVLASDGSILQVSGSATRPLNYQYVLVPDGIGGYLPTTIEIHPDATGSTNEWVQTILDHVGRLFLTVYSASSPPFPAYEYIYNTGGQLVRQLDPENVSTVFAYNGKGEKTYTALDMDRDGNIALGGSDRVTFVTNDVAFDNGTNVLRTRTYVWNTVSLDASTLVSVVETSVDGSQTWSITLNNSGGSGITNHSQTAYFAASGLRVVTETAPDGSTTVTTNQYGRRISVTVRDSTGLVISQTVFGYDAHGRPNSATDIRTGTSTFNFDAADNMTNSVTPVPGSGQSAQSTTNFFDNMGRIWKTTLPDLTSVTNKYNSLGLATNAFGSRTYPVGSTFETQGRLKTMTTWKNAAAGASPAVTTWNYDPYQGWLSSKTYNGGAAGPTYSNTAAGRLAKRTWARGTNTIYSPNAAGENVFIAYSDGSPSIQYGFDRRGRLNAVTNGANITALAFGDANQLLSESISGGLLAGISITNGYDPLLRRTNLAVLQSNNPIIQQSFSLDGASRLATVSDGTNTASYGYLPNSSLVQSIVYKHNNTVVLTRTNQFDNLNRLTNLWWTAGSTIIASYAYQYNTANQRTRVKLVDGSYWLYGYDYLGQVISARHYWADGTLVAGEQFEFTFDDIGNRTTTRAGGDPYGRFLRNANYTNNSLNQITSRDVPGYLEMLGSANPSATVTLWSPAGRLSTPAGNYSQSTRHGDFFQGELAPNNTTGAVWIAVTNLAVLQNGTSSDLETTNVGNIFVPKTPETFSYDPDGNMTSDGRFTVAWDAENRAISFTSLTNAPVGSKVKVDCAYDDRGRRIQKVVSAWSGSNYVAQSTNRFVYDGWNLIAILSSDSQVLYSFAWGTDLSGTQQGAGGVGGLVSMTVYSGTNAGTYFSVFDGHGNVVALVNAATGSIATQYEYGPFGEVLRASGPLAQVNPFLFSTKFYDWETGLFYYGYRYYNPSAARWLSRDPAEGSGENNPYEYASNDPVGRFDYLGLWTKEGVLRLLCKCRASLPKDCLANVKVFAFDEMKVTWDEYEKNPDGTKGKPKPNNPQSKPIQGLTDPGKIYLKNGLSDEEAAATAAHECEHYRLRKPGTSGSQTPTDEEVNVFIVEEQYRIDCGLPPGGPAFRKKGSNGKEVPDAAAIRAYVTKSYGNIYGEDKNSWKENEQLKITGERQVNDWKCP